MSAAADDAQGNREDSGEDRLIARYFRPLATDPGAFDLRDDAATLMPPPGMEVVLQADALVGGVHFFPDDPADLVARKALRVNLSDLAAKGATPAGFLLTLALPAETSEAWLQDFARGLGDDAAAFGCPLLGGDTVRTSGPVVISISAFGLVPQGRMVRRAGAQAGDVIVVTGTIGDSALGLLLRTDAAAAARWKLDHVERGTLAERYLLPQPRLALAKAVLEHATAAMDVSDGLAGDLAKLCGVSGVDAEVDAAKVPFSAAAAKAIAAEPGLLQGALSGGDDYEIIATLPAAKLGALRSAGAATGVPVTEIGRIVAGRGGARFFDHGQQLAFERTSFSHF